MTAPLSVNTHNTSGFVALWLRSSMFFRHWISGGSLWFSSLLVRILGATGWLLGFQGEKRALRKDIESDQDAIARGVITTQPRRIDEYVSMNSKGNTISGGATGLVERLPSGDVIKSPWPGIRAANCRRDMTTEANIYEILGPHPRLVKLIDWNPEDCSLTMEYMPNGCLKDYLHAHNDKISMIQRLQWVQEAAEGVQLLHSANIIHSDIEPKNFLLDADMSLRIADFSGSSLDGSQASACAGTRFEPPSFSWRRTPTIKDDLFSLGSTIYAIITGQYPFQELSSDEVREYYKADKFPNVTGITCGELIDRCWHCEVDSAQEIYDFIQKEKKLPCYKSETFNNIPKPRSRLF